MTTPCLCQYIREMLNATYIISGNKTLRTSGKTTKANVDFLQVSFLATSVQNSTSSSTIFFSISKNDTCFLCFYFREMHDAICIISSNRTLPTCGKSIKAKYVVFCKSYFWLQVSETVHRVQLFLLNFSMRKNETSLLCQKIREIHDANYIISCNKTLPKSGKTRKVNYSYAPVKTCSLKCRRKQACDITYCTCHCVLLRNALISQKSTRPSHLDVGIERDAKVAWVSGQFMLKLMSKSQNTITLPVVA